MTDDFREGLIAGYERVIDIIQIQATDPKLTDASKQALDTLTDAIKLDMNEAERA
jgi:hypothetical protein